MLSYTDNELNYIVPKEAWEIVSCLTRNSKPNKQLTGLIDSQGEYKDVFQKICSTDKVTIIFENGFKRNSDTEDVFQGMLGCYGFEENCSDALEGEEFEYTGFPQNGGLDRVFIERMILDGYWTSIILHGIENPEDKGLYVMIHNKEQKQNN
ncbi:hypothetical protein [Bacillus sp. NPDC094106]|uniref:hypothetical protein n=1 Tax=Bacillus sp. NPDC094106 TaxID=3363949 RepID=UPI0038284391